MVLFCIVGELGAGKTLALAYLGWNNWFKKGRRLFSNFSFYGFPHTKITAIPDLEKMQSGFFAGDELWTWLDSWEGKSEKQRLISNILLKSRKRDITIAYTTQTMQQITKRIRDITDFIAYPVISMDGTYCRMEIFRGPKVSPATRINPARYFNIEPVIAMYNTYEEIKPVETEGEFEERFFHMEDNVAWHRYCREALQLKDEQKIRTRARSIESSINPWGYKSEEDRKDKAEDYSAI